MQTTAGLLYFGLFTLTGLWFWAIISAWVIVTFIYIHKEQPGWASFWLIAFLIGLHLGGVVNVIEIVLNHPWKILGLFGAYIGVGLVWTIFKFKMWSRDRRILINNEISQLRNNFLKEYEINETSIPKNLQEKWQRLINGNMYLARAKNGMNVEENKGRLTLWAVWWPISMIWTFISDWITKIFNLLIFDMLGGLLGRIVESEKAKISVD